MTYLFLKLRRAVPEAKIIPPNIVTAVLEIWAIPYGALNIIPANNGKQLTSKFFAALCVLLGIK